MSVVLDRKPVGDIRGVRATQAGSRQLFRYKSILFIPLIITPEISWLPKIDNDTLWHQIVIVLYHNVGSLTLSADGTWF